MGKIKRLHIKGKERKKIKKNKQYTLKKPKIGGASAPPPSNTTVLSAEAVEIPPTSVVPPGMPVVEAVEIPPTPVVPPGMPVVEAVEVTPTSTTYPMTHPSMTHPSMSPSMPYPSTMYPPTHSTLPAVPSELPDNVNSNNTEKNTEENVGNFEENKNGIFIFELRPPNTKCPRDYGLAEKNGIKFCYILRNRENILNSQNTTPVIINPEDEKKIDETIEILKTEQSELVKMEEERNNISTSSQNMTPENERKLKSLEKGVEEIKTRMKERVRKSVKENGTVALRMIMNRGLLLVVSLVLSSDDKSQMKDNRNVDANRDDDKRPININSSTEKDKQNKSPNNKSGKSSEVEVPNNTLNLNGNNGNKVKVGNTLTENR